MGLNVLLNVYDYLMYIHLFNEDLGYFEHFRKFLHVSSQKTLLKITLTTIHKHVCFEVHTYEIIEDVTFVSEFFHST